MKNNTILRKLIDGLRIFHKGLMKPIAFGSLYLFTIVATLCFPIIGLKIFLLILTLVAIGPLAIWCSDLNNYNSKRTVTPNDNKEDEEASTNELEENVKKKDSRSKLIHDSSPEVLQALADYVQSLNKDVEEDDDDSVGEITFNKFEDGVEIIMAKENGIKLSDVVISSSANELQDLTEYMQNPENFDENLYVPTSKVLIIGENGLGKSALIKAFANTVGLMIFRVSAARLLTSEELIEKLFEIARSGSPYIIQIDNFELFAGNSGNEASIGITTIYETLKTYLDIFDNIIVFACISTPSIDTSEIERTFKKVIEMDFPNLQERTTLLYEFGANSGFTDDVDLTIIAKNCMGFTISDLKALVGNAICLARRDKRSQISSRDLLEVWDKMQLGNKTNTMYSKESRELVSYHEAGHALLSYLLQGEEAVFRVVSIGHGSSGGVTCSVPDEDSVVRTQEEMLKDVCMCYGGRAAEKLIFAHYSSGASSDIRMATSIIVRMVQAFGMSEKIGPLNVEPKVALLSVITDGNKIQDLVSEECHRIAIECDEKAEKLLQSNINKLHALAKYLIDNESITGEDMVKLFKSIEG